LSALLAPSCVIKEEKSGDNSKGGASSEVGGAGQSLIGGNSSAGGGAGSAGESSGTSSNVTTTLDACKDLDLGDTCSATSMAATYNNIHMLIVLDKSGSMTQTPAGFSQSKWDATRDALDAALTSSTKQVRYGLLMYPYSLTTEAKLCEVPLGRDAINVPVDTAKTSVPLIKKALEDTVPGGGTPTAAALAAALEYYSSGTGATLEGDRYVMLATDGGPNCNADASCDTKSCTYDLDKQGDCGTTLQCCQAGFDKGQLGCLDSDGVLAQIEALKKIGVKTFVVGIPGTESYQQFLTTFAEAGGATDPKNQELKYYAVTAADGVEGLTATFKSITESLVRDCNVKMAKPPLNPQKLNVAIECKPLAQGDAALKDSEKNWIYNGDSDNPVIKIQGAACDAIEKTGVTRVDVIEGCTTLEIQ
jgi:hypothetical protein